MKKNVLKKLHVSRETLLALTSLEAQKVAGAADADASKFSCPSACGGRPSLCPMTLTQPPE
jgi:hypothetical protein